MRRPRVLAAITALLVKSTLGQNCTAAPAQTYDYIVIGSGAGGIPTADRLSEAGFSVLLLEKGPPSSGRWGGTMKPSWLENTNLSRFDVPGLFNQIWADSNGIACDDHDVMSGCVLGGGVAVNSALWWKPHPNDWDVNFPAGWKSTDMESSVAAAWARIPGTYIPSRDGQLYNQQGFNAMSKGLDAAGFKYVVANDHPDQKNLTYSHSTFFLENAERNGPLGTYLVTASKRKNFSLWTNTAAKRLVRKGGHITGVEIECNKAGAVGPGHSGTVQLTNGTGRVILSAGAFGTPKILFRSGIGPADQLKIVNGSSDGPTMISSDQWIDLPPVGSNLNDHVGTQFQIAHPDVVQYDFFGAYNNPIQADAQKYLQNRSGMLAQVAPNLGPIFWHQVTASDGGVRHTQYQAASDGYKPTAMGIVQYLGVGTKSRGRMAIQANLNTRVATAPYLRDQYDKEAMIKSIDYVRSVLSGIPNMTWLTPTASQTTTAFVNSLPAVPGVRGSNHWVGTCKIGTDDGRAGGTAVVDLDTKVYGTDNLFVVDASIFPGLTTGNPSGAIVSAAEHAAKRILALKSAS